MDRQSDEALLKEFLRGNDQAFARFVRRHQDVIYRLALKNLNNEEMAREAAQEVFVRAGQKLKSWRFGLGGKPFSWLYRTMLNVCSEMRKKHRREGKKVEFDERFHANIEILAKHEDIFEKKMLEGLVDSLPYRQQEIVLLHIYEGKTLSEAAETLQIPVGTVKSNYFKALGNLRRSFSRMKKREERRE